MLERLVVILMLLTLGDLDTGRRLSVEGRGADSLLYIAPVHIAISSFPLLLVRLIALVAEEIDLVVFRQSNLSGSAVEKPLLPCSWLRCCI